MVPSIEVTEKVSMNNLPREEVTLAQKTGLVPSSEAKQEETSKSLQNKNVTNANQDDLDLNIGSVILKVIGCTTVSFAAVAVVFVAASIAFGAAVSLGPVGVPLLIAGVGIVAGTISAGCWVWFAISEGRRG